MNIDFLITSLGGGGAERVVCNLANYLVSKKDNVTISVIRGGTAKYNLDEQIKVNYFQKNYYDNPVSICERVKEVKKVFNFFQTSKKDHIIVCFLELPIAYALVFKHFVKAKLIICERNNPEFYTKGYQCLYRLLANRTDLCVCQTKVIADWYCDVIADNNKIKVIPNSINSTILDSIIGKHTNKEIVSMARLAPQKNQRLLIEAFAEISREYPDYRLTIYGEGPLRQELTDLIASKGLSEKVTLPGFTSDVIEVFNHASMFVMTSDHEGMPNALAEAIAMGVPSISTDCGGGGARELIDDGKNGFLVPCGDLKSLISAMKKIISDPNMATQFSHEAYMIRERLNPDIIHSQWRYLFQNCYKR